MKPSIHRLAEQDLRDAAGFYRREAGAGVALRFLAEFERIVDLLVSEPGIGTPTAGGRQAFPLAGFPYSVIYPPLSIKQMFNSCAEKNPNAPMLIRAPRSGRPS